MKKITLLLIAILMSCWLSFSQTPTTVASFNVSSCPDAQTTTVSYDGAVESVVWVEVIYDGSCLSLTADTETSDFDTEIGIYDAAGNLIANDDDGGTGTLSSLTEVGLAAGTYYVAAGGFNTTFGATLFDVTSTSTTTGSLSINVSTPSSVVTPPTTVGTLTVAGCGDLQTYSAAYDGAVDGVVWLELIYDGNCTEITVDTETSDFDTEIGLYDSNGLLLGNNDDGGTGTLSSYTEAGLAAGTYYIATGAFNIVFNSTNFDATTTTSTTGALVVNASTPSGCVAPTIDSSTVMDSCNPDGTGTFTVDIVVSDAGDAGSVFDDGINPTEPVVAGTVTMGPYNSGDSITIELIAVEEDCSSTVGTFDFTCPQPAPENDECAGAIEIACDGQYTGDTSSANPEDPDPGTCGTTAGTAGAVWYRFTGANSGNAGAANGTVGDDVTLDLSLSTFDTKIRVFEGGCDALVCVGGNDDGGAGTTSLFTFTTTVGTDYFVLVHGFSGNVGEYTLDVSCVAPPACTPATIDSSTVMDSCNPDGTGTFTVDIVVSDAGDAGSVFDDGINPTEPVVAGTVTMGPYNSGDSVTIELTALDAACSSTVGTFEFTCPQPGPENDDCAGAIEIACDGQYTGDTTNANPEDPDPGFCGTSAGTGGAVWYRFTGANSSDAGAANGSQGDDVTLDLSLSTFDTKIRVFEGGCDALVCVGGNDDGGTGTTSLITLTTTVGTDYFVLVHGFSTNAGAYTLDVSCVPPPSCIPATFALSDGGNTCPSEDGFIIDVDVTSLGSASSVNILLDGTPVFSGVDGTASPYSIGGLDAATDYDVTIEDAADDTCAATESYSTDVCPPENDAPAGAVEISVGSTLCESPTLGSNVGATDSGEGDPSCGVFGYEGGDVWFKVMVPATGELTIETSSADGSDITDTTMEVYSGTSGSLSSLGCDDDGGDGLFSRVELTGLTPGDVLLIRVWEFGDDVKGDFNICAWSPTSLSVEDDTFAGFNYYPNPVKDVLTLDSPRAIDKIEVFNVLGQRIIAIDSQDTIQNIDMSNLQAGAYIVKVSIETQTKVIRVLKE